MHLREYTEKDALACAQLHERTVRKVNAREYPLVIVDRWVDDCCSLSGEREKANGERRFLVEEEGTLLGFGGARLERREISSLFVGVEARGRGIGSLLLSHLELLLQKENAEVVFLHSSLSARTFYEQHGYHVIEPVLDRGYIPTWHMKKSLIL